MARGTSALGDQYATGDPTGGRPSKASIRLNGSAPQRVTAEPPLETRIRHRALELGFSAAGIAPAEALQARAGDLARWLARGDAAGMEYMASFRDRQAGFLARNPGLKSFLVLAAPYSSGKGSGAFRQEHLHRPPQRARPQGLVAAYAWGRDYHKVLQKRITQLADFIRQAIPGNPPAFAFSVDTAPVQERVLAEAAGLGFFGKNTCLIHPKGGSFFFLAVLGTDLHLEPDKPLRWDCGDCAICIDACPTKALREPYRLDANRCIAYQTIENHGEIPEPIRPALKDWLFGCDICQQVCPYNKPSTVPSGPDEGRAPWPEFSPEAGTGDRLLLQEVLALRTREAFLARFAGTPLIRAKREGLVRNACVVAGNLLRNPPEGVDEGLLSELKSALSAILLDDSSKLVRAHAAWALLQGERPFSAGAKPGKST